MAKIHVKTNGGWIAFSESEDIDTIPGYCLVEMRAVYLAYPAGSMGSLFTCPCCGLIDDKEKTDRHVFNPSAPLITVLEMGKA